MENSLISSPLPDRETFARVWQRVMPEPGSSPLRLRPPKGDSTLTAGTEPLLTPLLESLSRSLSACQRQSRQGGPAARNLSVLSAGQRQSLRQLSALFYLRTGAEFHPSPAAEKLLPLPCFLRREYLLCRRLEALAAQLAQGEQDPCFFRILQEFQADSRRWAALLCTLLSQFLPPS